GAAPVVAELPGAQPAGRAQAGPAVGDDAEVAAAAAQAPEEIGVLLLARSQALAVGRDDGRSEQVVEREAVQTDQVPDPAAERQPRDTGITEGPAGRGEPVAQARWIEGLPKGAAAA